MSRSILISTVSASLLALAAPAFAQPIGGVVVHGAPPAGGFEVKSRLVRFRDIDVNSPDGARILFHRIRAAAEDVCSPAPVDMIKFLPERQDWEDYANCQADGIRVAVAEVNSPALTRYVDGLR
jgi:UrcA family protein